MDARTAAIVGIHGIVAVAFLAVSLWSAWRGNLVGAVVLGVVAVLVLLLGIGLARL